MSGEWLKLTAPVVLAGAIGFATALYFREPSELNPCDVGKEFGVVYGDPEGSAPGTGDSVELSLCDQGNEVGTLQDDLIALRYPVEKNNVFDVVTRKAVVAIQTKHQHDQFRLTIDGIVGRNTREAIQYDLNHGGLTSLPGDAPPST